MSLLTRRRRTRIEPVPRPAARIGARLDNPRRPTFCTVGTCDAGATRQVVNTASDETAWLCGDCADYLTETFPFLTVVLP